MGERERDERASVGGQLHRGGEAALDDREVADGEVAIQVVEVAVDLDAVAVRQRRRVDAGAGDDDHPQRRNEPPSRRDALQHPAQQRAADTRASHGDDAHPLVGTVAELRPHRGPGRRRDRVDAVHISGEREVRLGPRADRRQPRTERPRHDVVGLADEDRAVALAGWIRSPRASRTDVTGLWASQSISSPGTRARRASAIATSRRAWPRPIGEEMYSARCDPARARVHAHGGRWIPRNSPSSARVLRPALAGTGVGVERPARARGVVRSERHRGADVGDPLDPLRRLGGEDRAPQRSARQRDERAPVGAGGVHHRERVGGELRRRVCLPAGRPIRAAVPAAVERDHSPVPREERDLRIPAPGVDDRPRRQQQHRPLAGAIELPCDPHPLALDVALLARRHRARLLRPPDDPGRPRPGAVTTAGALVTAAPRTRG